MNKMIITGFAVATAFAAVAMPTKQELVQARKPVEEATKADLAALKAGQKTAKVVAESHLALASKAKNQAEKYLYYQGAFKLYARSGEYDLAADALDGMKRDVKDVPPDVIIELAGEEMRYVADEKAPRLLALIEEAKRMSSAECEKPQVVNNGISDGKEKVGGYVWSYRVSNGEATIMAEEKDKDGKINSACAISPKPTGRVDIPASLGGVKVTRIGGGAFTSCGNLMQLSLPQGLKNIGDFAFGFCDKITFMEIPSSVTNIGGHAFHRCNGLSSLTIPNGVTSLGKNFCFCCEGLKTVTISANVMSLESSTFVGCSRLESVTMLGERPNAQEGVFTGCGKLKAIHVPPNAKSWAGMKEWQGIPLVFDAK